ncbi:MAG: hypothetical protein JWO82_2179 [Akkermansiaceae bacterium]|nr:hypothetical protein [Akkermansiaceae bacterium]
MRQRNQCDDEGLAAGAANPRLAVEGLSDEALQGALQELMRRPEQAARLERLLAERSRRKLKRRAQQQEQSRP